jgi:hypothetical protein
MGPVSPAGKKVYLFGLEPRVAKAAGFPAAEDVAQLAQHEDCIL